MMLEEEPFVQYVHGTDLFNPSQSPRDRAIGQALWQTVELWIEDNMQDALTCLNAAEEFIHTDDATIFNP